MISISTYVSNQGVDATTHWFDVEQAHLSFQRQPQSSDSSMPSLRRLVRPTEWETVRSKLKTVRGRVERSCLVVFTSQIKSSNVGGPVLGFHCAMTMVGFKQQSNWDD